MFARLGTWCHDHRRLVLGLVDRRADRGQRRGLLHRRGLPAGLLPGRVRVHRRLHPGRGGGSQTAVAPPSRARSCSPPTSVSTIPRSEPAWSRCWPRSPRSPRSPPSRVRTDPGGESQIATRGDAAGRIAFATVYLPEDIDFTRASEVAEEIRDLSPVIEGPPGGDGRAVVRRVRTPVVGSCSAWPSPSSSSSWPSGRCWRWGCRSRSACSASAWAAPSSSWPAG